MNYAAIYEDLITRARSRDVSGYSERHHVVPRCMGGTDEVTNLVDLTPEEHYLAHQLLARIHRNSPYYGKLIFACRMLGTSSAKYKPPEALSKLKEFGWVKRAFAAEMSKLQTGKTVSAETRQKLSEHRKGKPGTMLGKKSPWTSERNRKLKGTTRVFSEVHKANHLAAISKPRPQTVKDQISKTKTGVPRKKLACPHCSKVAGEGNYQRWHGDNCRFKPVAL